MERCDGYDGGVRMCGKVGQLSGSVSPKEVCQLVGRCDGHGEK